MQREIYCKGGSVVRFNRKCSVQLLCQAVYQLQTETLSGRPRGLIGKTDPIVADLYCGVIIRNIHGEPDRTFPVLGEGVFE